MNRLSELEVGDLPAGLVVFDASGAVTDANQTACEILGVEHDRLVGSSAEESGWVVVGPPGDLPAESVHPAVQATRSRRPQRGVVVRMNRPDGSTAWLQVDAAPDLDADGTVGYVVAALTDVTPLIGGMGIPTPANRARSVAEITDQLANARLGPEAILTTVITSLSRLRPGTWVAALIGKDPFTARVVAASDSDPIVARYVEEMHTSGEAAASTIATQVIETGRPVLMPNMPFEEFLALLRTDVRSYLDRNAPPVSSAVRNISVLVVPMRARGATIGTIGVFGGRSQSPFTESDLDWLQAIADRTGLATENAQLYADAVRRLGRLNALRNLALAISGSPDLRLTLQVLLDQVTAGLGVDAADVMLLDEGGGSLSLAAQTGFQSTSIPEYRLPVDDRLPGRLLAKPRTELVTEGSAFSQFRRRTLFAREGFRAYCAAPLVARGKATGVLEIFQRSALQPDDEWLGFLEAVAGYAAIAIEGATTDRLKKPARPGLAGAGAPRLSALERQILSLVIEGDTNAAIAQVVHLSQSTVKFHVRQILQKAGAGNRTELAHMATKDGWL